MHLMEQAGVAVLPARVVRSERGMVEVALADRLIWAEKALCMPRELYAEDRVLVLQGKEAAYVIGVLASDETVRLTVDGDLHVRAPGGRIECLAGEGMSVTAPALSIIARHAQVIARSITESFEIATRAVKGLFITRAGSEVHETEGDYRTQAGSVTSVSAGVTRIDGSSIHLG